MWSSAWNKAHFRNLMLNTYLPSTVSRVSEWWSRDPGFNSNGGNFRWISFCSSLYEDLSDYRIKNPIGILSLSIFHVAFLFLFCFKYVTRNQLRFSLVSFSQRLLSVTFSFGNQRRISNVRFSSERATNDAPHQVSKDGEAYCTEPDI